MNYYGNVQLTMVFVATPDLEAEGDRIFKSHAAWMEETHYREGEKALLQYTVAKGTDNDGNIHYSVTEVYKTTSGHKDHKDRAPSWKDFEDWKKFAGQCKTTIKAGTVVDSLW